MIKPRHQTHRAIRIGVLLLSFLVPRAAHAGALLSARVVGAGNPIVGATVRIYAAGPSAATLLGSGQTDSSGAVSITIANPGGNAVLYALAVGGDAGHGPDSAIAMLSTFGLASNYTSTIVIDELTTIVSVWSMRAFIHSDRSIFGPSPGLQNAALTVANLANLAEGRLSALLMSTAPDKVNTLSNLLAACVGSSGASSLDCVGLFSNATPPGLTPPQDTMEAAVAIANNPVLNLAQLFAISSHMSIYTPSYTQPPYNWLVALTLPVGIQTPTVLAIDSSGSIWVGGREPGVAKLVPPGIPAPGSPFIGGGLEGNLTEGIAIDPYDHAWILNDYPATTISELNSDGSAISPPSGYPLVTNQYSPSPVAIASDRSGNIWITNTQQYPWYGRLFVVGQNGQTISQFDGPPAKFEPTSLVIDAAGDAWVLDYFKPDPRLRTFNSSGVISHKHGYTIEGRPGRMAIDGKGNIWISNDGVRVGPKKPPYHYLDWIVKVNSKGKTVSPPHGYRGGGIGGPEWIAVDGAGNIWVYDGNGVPSCGGLTNFNISELDPNGNPISPEVGYPIAPSPSCGGSEPLPSDPPNGLSIDPSGNIWIAYVAEDALLEIVGAATPVRTPLIGPPRPLSKTGG